MIYWLKTHYLLDASKVIFHSRGAVVWDRMDWKQTVVLYLHLCVLTTRAGLSPVRGSAVTRYGRKCKCESAHVVKSVGEKDKAAIVTRATHPSLATDIRARARTYIIAIYIRGLRVFLLLRFFSAPKKILQINLTDGSARPAIDHRRVHYGRKLLQNVPCSFKYAWEFTKNNNNTIPHLETEKCARTTNNRHCTRALKIPTNKKRKTEICKIVRSFSPQRCVAYFIRKSFRFVESFITSLPYYQPYKMYDKLFYTNFRVTEFKRLEYARSRTMYYEV